MTHALRPSRFLTLQLLALTTLLLAGCFNRNTPTGPQIQNMLPTGWTPVEFAVPGIFRSTTVWTPVNVDGDASGEYLLYFRYDNNQIGAVIYKESLSGSGAGVLSPTPIPAPNQPAGGFLPYRLAPSYWPGSGTAGFVAPPQTTAEQITTLTVRRDPPPGLAGSTPVTATVDELVILGGDTLMTVAWWQNAYNGYGVTQVQATGGLVNRRHQGDDTARPVESIIGLEPLADPLGRSLLCRQWRYVRGQAPEEPTTLPNPHASAVHYTPNDEGIVFCDTPLPAYPFYPEGVALAFLRPEDRTQSQTLATLNDYRVRFVQNGDRALMNQWLALVDFDGPDNETAPTIIIDELVAPVTLPLTTDFRSDLGQTLTSAACARVRSPDGQTTRVLLLDLLYQEPTLVITPGNGNQAATSTTTTDRLIITNVTDQTATNLTCQQLVANATAATGQTGTQP
jgi:hypothetical protein